MHSIDYNEKEYNIDHIFEWYNIYFKKKANANNEIFEREIPAFDKFGGKHKCNITFSMMEQPYSHETVTVKNCP